MTLKAVGLGLFLALVFGAANAYLGMKAGQTIAATIPAAVIAIAVFRVWGGGILEQNITRTAASVGEAMWPGRSASSSSSCCSSSAGFGEAQLICSEYAG